MGRGRCVVWCARDAEPQALIVAARTSACGTALLITCRTETPGAWLPLLGLADMMCVLGLQDVSSSCPGLQGALLARSTWTASELS